MSSTFLYATLAPESLKHHKLEMTERHPEFRFAFSRPGLVTWKSPTPLAEDFRPNVAIALTSGVSLGSFETTDLLLERLALEPKGTKVLAHYRPVSESAAPPSPERIEALESALARAGHLLPSGGERFVLDVVVPAMPNEPLFLGRRKVRRFDPRTRDHFERTVPPPESPSRAYAKLAEALARLEKRPDGGAAIELGAAPGGAVLRLLEEGLDVTAVDPAELSPTLSSLAESKGRTLVHLRKPAGELNREELPSRIRILVCDMNLAPQVVVPLVRRTLNLVRGTPGVLLTLKLNDDRAVVSLPRIERDLRRDFPGLELVKLPSHRTEVLAIAAP